MAKKVHNSKWNKIFSNIVLTNIPFDYVRSITLYYNNISHIAYNRQDLENIIGHLVTENYLDMESISEIEFSIDFSTRKFRKEVKRRVNELFSKYLKV